MIDRPMLTATPNPVPYADAPGTATVAWSTGSDDQGVVAIAVDGGTMRPFAEGSSGSAPATWIEPGHRYRFTLIGLRDGGEVLASLDVAMEDAGAAAGAELAGAPFIRASPNPLPYSADPGTVAVEWSTGGTGRGRVTVSIDGGEPVDFALGSSGSAMAAWIAPGRRYLFALHPGQQTDGPIATAEVAMEPPLPIAAAATPGRPFISASPNPVPLRQGPGTTMVSWSTAGRGPGHVTVYVPGGAEQPFHDGPEGHADATWIQPGQVYVFRLYADPGRQERLGSVTAAMASPLRERLLDIAVLAGAGAAVASAVAIPVSLAIRVARRARGA